MTCLWDTCNRVKHTISRRKNPSPHHSEPFWALKDISFDVERGDVVGIIGPNGAGKSTLLKILSRITAPTTGRVEINGRIDSLLEVGTGFHAEMSGRENIYLNAALHGLTRREIDDRMEDIVKFSGVEEFLDTPVKYYSSGMGVRLGFAVAAHMDPDILVVDEVLAVGDLEFQKKCLGKMKEVSEGGRTVLFVSHNLGLINQLCSRSIWIENGQIYRNDTTNVVVSEYMRHYGHSNLSSITRVKEDFSKIVQIMEVSQKNIKGELTSYFECDEPVLILFKLSIHTLTTGLYGYLGIYRNDGLEVMMSDSFDTKPNPLDALPVGLYDFVITIPSRTLGPGNYYINHIISLPYVTQMDC